MAITHRNPLIPPALPALGPRGFAFTDPTFGSQMVRVTDADFATDLGSANRGFHSSASGYQREWNADSTKFWVSSSSGGIYLVSFNEATLAVARVGAGLALIGDLSWSDTDPNILYGVSNSQPRVLCKLDVSTVPPVKTTVLDLNVLIPGLAQNVGSLSFHNGVLFCICGGIQETYRKVVWYPIADPGNVKVLDTQASPAMPQFFGMHSAQMERNGRVIGMVKSGSGAFYWDTTTGTVTQAAAPFGGGHEVFGFNTRINNDTFSGTYDSRKWTLTPSLLAPDSNKSNLPDATGNPLTPTVGGWGADHSCWHNATAANPLAPFISGTYRYGDGPGYANSNPPGDPTATGYVLDHTPDSPSALTPVRAWDDEIIGVSTDGSGIVYRYCHTRSWLFRNVPLYEPASNSDIFWYTPRPNVSLNGRWALFTSNWEKTLGTEAGTNIRRKDVFLVKLTFDVPPDIPSMHATHVGRRRFVR